MKINVSEAKAMMELQNTMFGFREHVYSCIKAAALKGEQGVLMFVPPEIYDADGDMFDVFVQELMNEGYTVCQEGTSLVYEIYWV